MYDFFLLSKEDLIELDLPIASRNRIIAIQKHYSSQGIPNLTTTNENGTIKADMNDFDI